MYLADWRAVQAITGLLRSVLLPFCCPPPQATLATLPAQLTGECAPVGEESLDIGAFSVVKGKLPKCLWCFLLLFVIRLLDR